MTELIQRYSLSFIEEDSDLPGLFQKADYTVWLRDKNGTVTQITGGGGGGGGLPTGWTQDSEDPSNVFTNGAGAGGTGSLTLGTEAGPENFSITSTDFGGVDEDGDQWIVAATGLGLLLTPKLSVGGPAITIDASQGATAAMDAGGQPVVDMADPVNPQDAVTRIFVTDQVGAVLPTSDPAEAGALWVDGAAGFVIKVSQG